MKTKSIRIPTDIISALSFVGKEEKVEESTAMRKLMRYNGLDFSDQFLQNHSYTFCKQLVQGEPLNEKKIQSTV